MHRLLAVTSALVALCSLGSVDSSAYDKIVGHSRIRARNEGPNMCALQRVVGTEKKYFSTCRNWYKRSICGRRTEVLYECCPGYMKLEGMRGCPAVAPIDHVYGTLDLVRALTTQEYTDRSGIREKIEGKGSFTLFAPSNEAWENLDRYSRDGLLSNVNVEMYNVLHLHMVNRRLLTKDLKNHMTAKSMYNDRELYIGHYPNGIVTVNCARIIHANQVATNGVVHVVDRVITVAGNTIKEVLDNTDDLSSLNAAVVTSGMADKLQQPGHFTLFAPTNAAFSKLSPGYLERIMADKDVLAALVKYHLLNSVQCSEAIMIGSEYETEEGSSIQIGCDGDSLTVNGIKMVLKKDIVTTNGVIHLIDQILIPDSAKEGMELLGASQSTFSDMVSELGLAAAMRPKMEYTLLAPVNTAFDSELKMAEKTQLRSILENHILRLKITLSELYNGQQLETLAGKLLRVFIYRTAVCIENACMLRGSKQGSRSALHLMKSIIKPADKTMYQYLVANGRFKIFLSLMETAGLTDLLKQEGSYTIFAPTDEAFESLSKEDFELLKRDLNTLRLILLYHFSNGIFINGGLEGGVTNLLKTLQGNNLQVLSVNNSIHVNSVDVPDSDLMATNGVIHVVKNVLYPPDLPVGRQDLLILLRKLIRYIQIKFVPGYVYTEIPLTFLKVTRIIQSEPSITKVTRIIESGEPTITKVTRVIEKEPSVTQVVIEGEPVVTKVTRVIDTQPSITTVRRVIEAEPSLSKVTRVITGDPSVTKVTRFIEGESSQTKVTRVISGDPSVTKVTRFIEGDASETKVTRVIVGEPSVTKVTRVIDGSDLEGKKLTGPDFSKITTVRGDPSLINEESERITKIIQGGRYAALRKPPTGMRRRARLVRRHHNPKA
ncbi:periostin isoform X2 [Nelusetta ayraudi]|uniref:periostin isoform X2 n=1 Tax=Nelusetta ayraudi TaxID=303726 RepID=UPI003F72873E